MFNKILIGLLILVSSFYVTANQEVCNAEQKTRFVFSNGMLNGLSGIEKSKKSMIGLVNELIEYKSLNGTPLFDEDEVYEFSSAYNVFSIYQLYQVVQQRNSSEKGEFIKWLNDIKNKPSWVTATEEEKLAKLMSDDSIYNDSKLTKMVNQYISYLDDGERVIIVAHSQGNMYANMAYDRVITLYPEYINSIGIISVASPDNRIISGLANYVTGDEDSIINLVRYLRPSTLSGNTRMGGLSPDRANHSFIDTYLSVVNSRNKIKDGIEYLIEGLTYPEGSENGGDIHFKLDKVSSNLHLGVYELIGGIPRFAASDADPIGDLLSPVGDIVTEGNKDIYTLRCDSLPKISFRVQVGVWNEGTQSYDAAIRYETPDGNITGAIYEIDAAESREYSIKGAIVVRYDEASDSYTYTHHD